MIYIFFAIFCISGSVFSQSDFSKPIRVKEIEVIATNNNNTSKTNSIKEDPSAFVNVISAESFRGKYLSLADVLEKEAGIRVKKFGGLGSYSTLSIRGSNSNQVMFYINGVPINNSQGGEINLSDLPFDSIERIEIYKSGSTLGLSSSAIGGSVNLIVGKDVKIKISRATISVGSLNTGKISASHSDFTEKVQYSILVQNEKSDQDFLFRNNNGTPVLNKTDDFDDRRRNAQFNRYNFSGNLAGELGKTKLTLLNDFAYRTNGIPGPGNRQTKKVEREYVRNTSAIGTETPEFLSENIKLETRTFYTGTRDHVFDPNSEFSSGTPNSKADIQQYGLHIIPTYYLLNYNQIIRFFVSLERETFQRDRRNTFDEIVDKSTRKFRNHSTFQLQDEIRFFSKKLNFIPSAISENYTDRYNNPETKEFNLLNPDDGKSVMRYTNYKLGLLAVLLQDLNKTISIKGNISSEKRAPNFLELFGERGSILGNTSLSPEKSKNSDIGPVVNYSTKKIELKTSLSLFSKNIKDMILFVPNSQFSLRPENIDSASIQGFEFSVKADIYQKIKFESNYTYQKAINTSDVSYLKGKYLPLRPMHDWFGQVSFYNRYLEIGIESHFIGAVFKDRTNEYVNYQPSRWIYNVFFSYYFGGRKKKHSEKEIMLSIEIKNISDTRAEDFVGYPLPGRLYYATLSGKF
ncbi:MAG: TonB-dependent receptor plug domain-containing protein [Leptospiraceae bacterium]|nr:TonB-dependent receptor plug domain-containing protein [Leptospiraceae bacterium]MCK6382303.1 TonB-dependent receptor plug domain-containing protein [Leptospiraceae bacterium]